MSRLGRVVIVSAVVCAGALVGALASLLLGRAHPLENAGLYTSRYAPAEIMEHAPVSPEVRAILTEGARGGVLRVSDTTGQPLTEGDALRGKEVFGKRCTGCHAMDQDREGPRLRGVFGRSSGSVPGFDYSPALQKAHIVWNEATLEKWLADPDALVPGNAMEFHVAKPQERRDLIRFLRDSAPK